VSDALQEPSVDPRDALIREQTARPEAQVEQVAALEGLVADLPEQLEAAARASSRNSLNSSVPPSMDDRPGRRRQGSSGVQRSGRRRRGRGSRRAARARRWPGKSRTGPRIITRKAAAQQPVQL
jgi:hypothetical protein